MAKSNYPVEAEGAKLYRDTGGGRAAWYKVKRSFLGTLTYEVGRKRTRGSTPEYIIVSNEPAAERLVDGWFE